jgi:phage gpG-like protein
MTRCADTLTGKSPYALPTLYVALCTTTPTAAAAGTEITTGQYGGYARQALTGASWSSATTGGACTYNALVDFGAASASTGTNVLGVELWDASTGGNRLWWEGLSSIAVSLGTHLSFASGQFVATIPPLAAGVGFSQTYAQKLAEHMVGKTTFGTAPAHWLALGSTAATTTAQGTELPYTGYARVQMTTASINAAAVVGANVDVVTNTQLNFGADTGGTQTAATFFYVLDASTVGNLIAGGSVTGGAVSSGTTPDFPSGSTIYRLN